VVEQKQKLPLWSKFLVASVVFTLISVFAGGFSLIYGVKRLGESMKDPEEIEATARDIAAFPDPLPAGYNYSVCLHLVPIGLAIVTIEHEPDKQLITFSSIEGTLRGIDQDPLEYGYSSGLNMLTTAAKFTDVIKKGKMLVSSVEMPYILGHTLDVSQKAGEGMIGCMQLPPKQPKKNIFIYALQTTNVPYNQQVTTDLLDSIKGFDGNTLDSSKSSKQTK